MKITKARMDRLTAFFTAPLTEQTLPELSWDAILTKLRFRTDPEARSLRKKILTCLWKTRAFSRHPELKPFLNAGQLDQADRYRQQTAFFLEAARLPGFQESMLEYLEVTGDVTEFQSVGH